MEVRGMNTTSLAPPTRIANAEGGWLSPELQLATENAKLKRHKEEIMIEVHSLEDRLFARFKDERRDVLGMANDLIQQAEKRREDELSRCHNQQALKDAVVFADLRRDLDDATAKSRNDGLLIKDHEASIGSLERHVQEHSSSVHVMDEVRQHVAQLEDKVKDIMVQQDDAAACQRKLSREQGAADAARHLALEVCQQRLENQEKAERADIQTLSASLDASRQQLNDLAKSQTLEALRSSEGIVQLGKAQAAATTALEESLSRTETLEKKVRDLVSAQRMQMEVTQKGSDNASRDMIVRLQGVQERLDAMDKVHFEQLQAMQEAMDANDIKSLEPRFEQLNKRLMSLHDSTQDKLTQNVGTASSEESLARLEQFEASLNGLQDAVRAMSLESASVAVLEQQLTGLQAELKEGSFSEMSAKMSRVEAHVENLQASAVTATQLWKARFEQLEALLSAVQAEFGSLDKRVRHVETSGATSASEASSKMKKDFAQCADILKQLSSEADVLKAAAGSDVQHSQAKVVQRGVEFLELSMKTLDMTSIAADNIAGSMVHRPHAAAD